MSESATRDRYTDAEEMANESNVKHPLVASDSIDIVVSNCRDAGDCC